MAIGGIDVVLTAPAGICHGDVIVRACQRLWAGHECRFQDVQSVVIYSLKDPWVWRSGTRLWEFFVYKNQKAVDDWKDGPTRSNRNTMLHFILALAPSDESTMEIAVVFDKRDKEINAFLRDLESSFFNLETLSFERARTAA